MIIEVRGTGVHNKGAELMFCAIREYFYNLDQTIQFAVHPQFGPYPERARYGLLSLVTPKGLRRSSMSIRLMSPSFRRTYGLVSEDEIDAVLDASGFAFGDNWGPGSAENVAAKAERFAKSGRPFILLPQAFGPFQDQRVAAASKRLIEAATLTFARDTESYEHVIRLVGTTDRISLAPDFTCLVSPLPPQALELPARFACLVPNIRMLDMVETRPRSAYITFLVTCIAELQDAGIEAIWLFHDPKHDRTVVNAVHDELHAELPIVNARSPVALKGILGQATLVIGSRFHALIGALVQNVPCIVVGWTHKYQCLMSEYSCPELILQPDCSRSEISAAIHRVLEPQARAEITSRLLDHNRDVRREANEMFSAVSQSLIGRNQVRTESTVLSQ